MFDLSVVSKYRPQLMGIAIIWVFVFHSGRIGIPYYDFISEYGWMGVDIFFFLSAFGMGYSLREREGFYKRRMNRILPTWITMLIIIHVLGVVVLRYRPDLPFHIPHSFSQFICWYTGIGFYIANIFNLEEKTSYYYEWYIPSLLLLYLITPFLYRQSNKVLGVLLIVALIAGQMIISYYNVYLLSLFITRIPIYILGILAFRYCCTNAIQKDNIDGRTIIVLMVALYLFFNLVDQYIYQIQKPYCVLFLIPILCLIFCFFIDKLKLGAILSFYGGISLELYLIHLYGRPHFLISFIFDNKCIIIFGSFLLCSLCAYIFKRVMEKIQRLLRFCNN